MEKNCFCCLECSIFSMGYDIQDNLVSTGIFPSVGVGICNKCMMYGYGPYNARRSWDPKWIDERLHETWYGCKEGDDGYLTDGQPRKTLWPQNEILDKKWLRLLFI